MRSSKIKEVIKHSGGRPRKFDDPSRPVTVTLPERTLSLLAQVDEDRARAIVKVTDTVTKEAWPDERRVRLVTIDEKSAVIVIGPSKRLKMIPWLRLVEVTPTNYLIAIPTGTPLEKLEVEIDDLIEEVPPDDEYERGILEDLRKLIGQLRRQDKMSKLEIILVAR